MTLNLAISVMLITVTTGDGNVSANSLNIMLKKMIKIFLKINKKGHIIKASQSIFKLKGDPNYVSIPILIIRL